MFFAIFAGRLSLSKKNSRDQVDTLAATTQAFFCGRLSRK